MKVTPWIILAVLGWTAVFTANSLAQVTSPKPPTKPAPKPPVSAPASAPSFPTSQPPVADDARSLAAAPSSVLSPRGFAGIGKFSLPTEPKEYRCKLEWSLSSAGTSTPIALDLMINTLAPTRSRELASLGGAQTVTHDFNIEVKGISGNEVLLTVDGSFLTNDGNYERTNEFLVTTVAKIGETKMLRFISKGLKGASRDTFFAVTVTDLPSPMDDK